VRGDQHRHADPGGQVPEEGEDPAAVPEIEIAGRLVRQENVRPPDDGARDGRPLSLPARPLVGVAPRLVGEAHEVERRSRIVRLAR
jgi:hypothetical protein